MLETQEQTATRRARSLVGVSDGRPGDDFYPTPDEATEALLDRVAFDGLVWEPACGEGDLCRCLERRGIPYVASDLNDHGFGTAGVDFLKYEGAGTVPNIVTNPPFRLWTEFAVKALEATRQGGRVVLFGKLAFLEGQRRKRVLYDVHPPRKVYVFSRRLRLTRNGEPYKHGGMIALAWFTWEKGWKPEIPGEFPVEII